MKAFTTRLPINTHVTPEKLRRALIRARTEARVNLDVATRL